MSKGHTPSNGVGDRLPLVSQAPQEAQDAAVPRLLPTCKVHTLVLSGELDRTTAFTLELTIERLREQGFRVVRLDLRGLVYIDTIGVAVIAFQSALWRRRGRILTLIRGPRCIQEPLELEGVAERLLFEADAGSASGPTGAEAAAAYAREGRFPWPRRGPAIGTLSFAKWRPGS